MSIFGNNKYMVNVHGSHVMTEPLHGMISLANMATNMAWVQATLVVLNQNIRRCQIIRESVLRNIKVCLSEYTKKRVYMLDQSILSQRMLNQNMLALV